MEYEEMMKELKAGKEIVNMDWNGLKTGKIMYIRAIFPDEHSLNTEPYIMFLSGTHSKNKNFADVDTGWVFKRFLWTPSTLDMWSNKWEIRKIKMDDDGTSNEHSENL